MESGQGEFFFDGLEDALGASVAALGGMKKASALIWPALGASAGEARLRACLNRERAEKFALCELVQLARAARDVGDHTFMNYLGDELGYRVTALEPANVSEELLREIRDQLSSSQRLLERLERQGARGSLAVAPGK